MPSISMLVDWLSFDSGTHERFTAATDWLRKASSIRAMTKNLFVSAFIRAQLIE